ncbi:MAG: septation protein A [Burkholderiaceae bacterium]
MKLLIDFLPIVLFFVAFKVYDIYVATGVAIAASVIQIAWMKLRGHRIEGMQWTSLAIICVFGGMTLLFHDETFIKWKPTVLYAAFAAALIAARYGFGRNLIESLMNRQVSLDRPVWDRLNLAWAAFFAVMAVVNIVVAYRFTTEIWVNFKLFGSLGLTILFIIGQALYLSRHLHED